MNANIPASVAFVKGHVLTTIGKADLVRSKQKTTTQHPITKLLIVAAIFKIM